MKITRILRTNHQISFEPPFQPSWDTRPRASFTVNLVHIETDSGLVGIGSGDSMAGFAGHEDLFIGQDPLDIERHFRVIENLSFHYGRCWPLDIALWDLYGKITDEPCWRLLGGRANRVRCYASSGSLKDVGALVDLARQFKADGFPAMKVRFQRPDWRDDIKAVEALRSALGNEFVLMVDCNQGWRMPWDTAAPWTLKDAIQVARELDDLDVYWMEEPLHRGDYAGMARLREITDLRIAGAEMTRELHELRELITRGCLDVLQPDAALTGGLTGLRQIAIMARNHNLEFTPHTWGNGIGLIANAHLAAGVAGSRYLEFPFDPPEWTPGIRDFALTEPITPDEDGWLDLGDAPGLGIELDEEKLERTKI